MHLPLKVHRWSPQSQLAIPLMSLEPGVAHREINRNKAQFLYKVILHRGMHLSPEKLSVSWLSQDGEKHRILGIWRER